MPRNEDLERAWAAAEAFPGVAFDIGRTVVCDFCDEDYTDSDATGGLLMGSKALCAKCVDRYSQDLAQDADEGRVAFALPELGETFADFVRRVRTHSTIRIEKR